MKKSKFFGSSYGYVRAAIALLLGLFLVIFPDVAIKSIIQIIGGFAIASGIVSLVSYLRLNDEEKKGATAIIINAIFSLLAGFILFFFPGFFAKLIIVILGILLTISGLNQIRSLYVANKEAKLSPALFIMPVLITIGGILLIFNSMDITKTFVIIFGVAIIVYAVSEILSTIFIKKRVDVQKVNIAQKVEEVEAEIVEDAEEVPYEEVK